MERDRMEQKKESYKSVIICGVLLGINLIYIIVAIILYHQFFSMTLWNWLLGIELTLAVGTAFLSSLIGTIDFWTAIIRLAQRRPVGNRIIKWLIHSALVIPSVMMIFVLIIPTAGMSV